MVLSNHISMPETKQIGKRNISNIFFSSIKIMFKRYVERSQEHCSTDTCARALDI